eukprot:3661660-Pyramimonas_sp.AAC.1
MVRVVPATATCHGPLGKLLGAKESSVSLDEEAVLLRVQEHQLNEKLPDFQVRAYAAGHRGTWSRALATDGGGTSGGVAILSPERIQITEPPLGARGQL